MLDLDVFIISEIIKYMSYKCILIIVTLCGLAMGQTDITMLNCPAQFNVTEYNVTTDNTVEVLGPLVYAGFRS